MSEGPLKRQKRDIVHVSRDMIECIARHCEWPELVALSRVSKRCREIALKFLPDALEELRTFFRTHSLVRARRNQHVVWSVAIFVFSTKQAPWQYPNPLSVLNMMRSRCPLLYMMDREGHQVTRYLKLVKLGNNGGSVEATKK